MYIEIMNVVKERTKKRKCAYQHRTARPCCTGIDDHVHTHAHTHTHTYVCMCVCTQTLYSLYTGHQLSRIFTDRTNFQWTFCSVKLSIASCDVFFQQKDGSRISGLIKDGKLTETIYEDVHTLYEAMLRGARLSSEFFFFFFKWDDDVHHYSSR